jgi:hypothetical protein
MDSVRSKSRSGTLPAAGRWLGVIAIRSTGCWWPGVGGGLDIVSKDAALGGYGARRI